MNNKYDVKNFSDLIDKFKTEAEVKTIEDAIKEQVVQQREDIVYTFFDPLIDWDDISNSKYQFT